MRFGSIPASAGEPPCTWTAARRSRVYPRECGGTWVVALVLTLGPGLSPRVRGNPLQVKENRIYSGSIPASAGEPGLPRPARSPAGVYPRECYPRECGGTIRESGRDPEQVGLSPRVRGNRGARRLRPSRSGSIPASAGEPPRRTGAGASTGVYPRECGGTRTGAAQWRARPGLSPRVRGNPGDHRRGGARPGSIPASAGEPGSPISNGRATRVYPRECGGT